MKKRIGGWRLNGMDNGVSNGMKGKERKGMRGESDSSMLFVVVSDVE
jgi:hypothetical protein